MAVGVADPLSRTEGGAFGLLFQSGGKQFASGLAGRGGLRVPYHDKRQQQDSDQTTEPMDNISSRVQQVT